MQNSKKTPLAWVIMIVFSSISRTMARAAIAVSVPKAGTALIVRCLHRLARISLAGMGGPAVTPPRATPASVPQGSMVLIVSTR